MSKLKLHAVSRADFIAKNYADFQTLLDNQVNPDDIPEKKVMSLGLKVFRLNERFQFLQDRFEKACIYLTKENFKPLNHQLHLKKSISNKDKTLFSSFVNSKQKKN